MHPDMIIGMAVIAAIVVGGLIVARLSARLVYPVRERLFVDAAALLKNGGLSSKDREVVNRYMDWALSFNAGWLVPMALSLAIKDKVTRAAPMPATQRRVSPMLSARFCGSRGQSDRGVVVDSLGRGPAGVGGRHRA